MITETKLARRQQMVIPELKLTKKVTADEEGTVFKLPRIVVEKREVERRRFRVAHVAGRSDWIPRVIRNDYLGGRTLHLVPLEVGCA